MADIDSEAIKRLKDEIQQNTDERKQLELQLNDLVKTEFAKTDREDRALNVGEWSEIYVFQRIMESGVLQAADCGDDGELVPIYDAFLPVLKVIREEFKDLGMFEYYTGNFENGARALKIYYGDLSEPLLECTAEEFREKADSLFENINGRTAGNVSCPDQVDFLEKIFIRKIKSPAREISDSLGGKSDITLQTVQPDRMKATAGFSIKSNVRAKPTLINSSGSNDIIYVLDGCTNDIMNRVNAVHSQSWVRDRTRMLLDEPGVNIRFERFSEEVCQNNLFLIADAEPEIVALSALYARDYPEAGRTNSHIENVHMSLCRRDPLHVGQNADVYYRKRLEDFLYAFACGMQSDKVWNGRMQINGGYITVSREGNLLVFCASNQDSYKRWLFKNTCFDTSDPNRHDGIGTVWYDTDGLYRYVLPLQIRFTT